MSMKRAKSKSSSARGASDTNVDFFARPVAKEKTWSEHTEGKVDGDFAPYALGSKFLLGSLVLHPKFGKGVIVEVEPQKVAVLFEDGRRKLGQSTV